MRLSAEAGALAGLTGVSESVLEPAELGRLRILRGPDDRRIAAMDYGPRSGRPVIVFHGSSTGRTLPPRFVAMLQAAGRRPIVPQRPGFGLTDRDIGDFLSTAADDLELVMRELRLPSADLLIRDAGAASALAFAERYPNRVRKALMINPHAPSEIERTFITLQTAVMRAFIARPEIIEPSPRCCGARPALTSCA